MDQGSKKIREPSPRQNAGFLSLITFFYSLTILRKGHNKELEEEDIYEVLPWHKSKQLGDKLENQWKLENKLHENPSIFRVLVKSYGKKYIVLGLVQFTVKTFMIITVPYALGKLVHFFTPGQTDITKDAAYLYASLLIVLDFLNALYQHNYILALYDLGIKIRTAFCSLIYRKSLKLSSATVSDFSTGKIVTMTTKDVHAFDHCLLFLNDLWIGCLHFVIIFYLIYAKVGKAAFVVLGFFLGLMPLVAIIGTRITSLRISTAKKSDERLQATQEVLSAIRIVKMYTWESFFCDRIAAARKKEVRILMKIYFLKALTFCLGNLCTQLCFFTMIMVYIQMGNQITPDVIYYVITCFHDLKHNVTISLPLGISQTAELAATLDRIGKFLKSQELEEVKRDPDEKIQCPRLNLSDVTVAINKCEVLKNISLTITQGLNMLTGGVGGGKTTLLKTILQECNHEGKMNVVGTVSYASQEPWLFPGSIQQNITFGEPFDPERYEKVLTVCALKYDLDILVNKDNTIVGDKGVNLSKGQQARVNLARAVYKQSDIYLLDDCLTSLDTHVQEYIFKECVQGLLRNKLIIFVTHNTNHIRDSDNVIVLKDGKVTLAGKPSDKIEEVIKDSVKEEMQNKENNNMEEMKNELNLQKDICLQEVELSEEEKMQGNLYQEVKQTGTVNFQVYRKYVILGGGIPLFILVVSLFIGAQIAHSSTDKIISHWVNLQQNISNFKMKNMTNTEEYWQVVDSNNYTMKLYCTMVIATAVLTVARSFLHFIFTCRASINIHKDMISKVVNATMEFFDHNFIGNILNRFSKDLSTIDEVFPYVTYEFLRVVLMITGVYILIITVNLTFVIPSLLFFVILIFIRQYYIPTGRSLKRLDASTRSPMIGHLNASLEGLATIRACGNQDKLKDEFDRHQDLYTSTYYTSVISNRGFSVCLDIICVMFISVILGRFLLFDTGEEAGNVGLAITQSFMLAGVLQWGVRQWAELENNMTSVERALEYVEVKSEDHAGETKENWPKDGLIKYDNVSLTYKKTNETVLRGISFSVEPQNKIGIVGRTGAGKSSIISTMFRLYEIDGKIVIDGVDTKTLSIDFLRSSVAIIPQDPVLFSGTIRTNIDPYKKYPDDEIWKALEIVELKNTISNLDDPITESGFNFSSGQRQLICLARAIVRKNKIVVLDEATANMDQETDALLHDTIQKKFATSTVITIAHRLHSVLDADKVMVVDKGRIIEYDKPSVLLDNKNSVFSKLVQQADLAENH